MLVDTIDIKYAYEMARSFGLSTVELLLGDIGHFLKETFLSDRMLYSIARDVSPSSSRRSKYRRPSTICCAAPTVCTAK